MAETLLTDDDIFGPPATSRGGGELRLLSDDDIFGASEAPSLVDRAKNAGAAFAQGAAGVAAAIPKQASIVSSQIARERLRAIDEPYTPPATTETGPTAHEVAAERTRRGVMGRTTPEVVAERRAILEAEANQPVQERPLYRVGEAMEDFVKRVAPTDDRLKDEWLAQKIPHGLGSVAGFMATGIVGRALGAGGATAAATGAASQSVEMFEDAINHKASLEDAFKAANLGAFVGTSEAVPIATLLDRLDKGTGGSVKQILRNAMVQGTEEAIQEAFQNIASNLIANKLVAYDPARGTFTGTGEAAGLGFTVGGIAATLGHLVMGGRRGRGAQQQQGDGTSIQVNGEERPDLYPDASVPEGAVPAETILPAEAEQPGAQPSAPSAPFDQDAAARTAEGFAPVADPIPPHGSLTRALSKAAQPAADASVAPDATLDASQAQSLNPDAAAPQDGAVAAQALPSNAGAEINIGGGAPIVASDNLTNQDVEIIDGAAPPIVADATEIPRETENAGTRDTPLKVESASDIERAAAIATNEHSHQQGEANNRQLGHVKWHGLDGSIEVAAGGVRKGTNPKTGETWETTHTVPYGYWKGTKGADGMHVDVYWGPEPEANHPVYVLDELDPDTGRFRQHKTLVGFPSQQAAEQAYLGTSTKTPNMIGGVIAMPVDEFTQWVKSGHLKKPVTGPVTRDRAKPRSASDGPLSLVQFIASSGGIRDDDPLVADLRHMTGRKNQFVPRYGQLIRPPRQLSTADRMGGKRAPLSLDAMREAAAEAGYLPQESTVADLLDLIDQETRGGKVYAQADEAAVADRKAERDAEESETRIREAEDDVREAAKAAGFVTPTDEQVREAATLTLVSDADPLEALVDVLERDAVRDEAGEVISPQEESIDGRSSGTQAIDAAGADQGRTELAQAGQQQPQPDSEAARGEAPSRGEPDQDQRARSAGDAGDGTRQPVQDRARAGEGEAAGAARDAEPEAVEPSDEKAQTEASKAIEGALDKIEEAVEAGDRKAVMDAARDAKKVLAGIPQSVKDAAPEYWEQFPKVIARMTKPGYVTAMQKFEPREALRDALERTGEGVTPDGRRFRVKEAATGTWFFSVAEADSSIWIQKGAGYPAKWSKARAISEAQSEAFPEGAGAKPEAAPVIDSAPAPDRATLPAPEGESDGLQGSVSERDARESAETVQQPEQERPARGARLGEGEGSESAVREPDGERAEGSDGVPAAAARPGSRGDGDGAADGISAGEPDDGAGRPGERASAEADGVKGENFSIAQGALGENRSFKTKAKDNIAAIELLRTIEAEGRPATREEQEQLARYVGWGGIKGAFPDTDGKYGKGFEEIGEKLKELLSDTEYDTARRSIQYAHYTAENVVRAMWSAAEQLGFKGGKVFEPGMGVGNFAGMMPPDVASNTSYLGLELDHITARIAKLLYPRWGVRRDDFTKAPLPDNTFDLIIGNPPFADVAIKSDPKYAKHGFFLHDYFFAKSLDALRPGGVLMFISSAGTMNKKDETARNYFADRADLVGAIRLPSNAFAKNAGTEVTTDIVILRKRLPGEEAASRTWTETVEVTLPGKDGKPIKGLMNRYFAENPAMVLGDQGFFDKLYEGRYAVHAKPGANLTEQLKGAIEALPRDVLSEWQGPANTEQHDFGSTEKKEGSFYIGPNGELMQMSGGIGRAIERRGKGVEGGKTAGEIERIKALIPIRDALRAVYAADLDGDAQNADKARARLNRDYDAFVAKFGPINKAEIQKRRPNLIQQESARNEAREEARYAGLPFDEGTFDPSDMIAAGATLSQISRARQAAREEAEKKGRKFDEGSFDPDEMPDVIIDKRPNVDAFMDDPESYRLRAIERYDDTSDTATKGPIFFENLITRERAPTINSVHDAVLYVLNQRGRLDIAEIAQLAGKSESEAIEALGERIYLEPGTRDVWLVKEQYLSGNVRKKLAIAKEWAEKNPAFRRNVEALEAVQPMPLGPSQIHASLGMPWIPEKTVEQFGLEALGLESLKVRYVPRLAQWIVHGDTDSAAASSAYGTDRRRAPALLSDLLNRQQIKIFDTFREPGGGTRTELNIEATTAANEKAAAIRDKFDGWIWADQERADALAALYNESYNNLVVREYDGSYLTTPGISKHWSWRPHQTRVVARIIQDGNTYMAHAVGAGKTSAMIGAGMEMRRLGLVRKPMYAVPNHMLGQFTKEFYEQYPTAKIAVADERRFHTDRRKQFIANVAVEDLDAIIITHSAMGMIPVSGEFQDGIIRREIDDYRALLGELKGQDNRITRARVEKQIERLEQRLTGKGNKRRDQVFTFEEMGVDFLFVDEAHLFRKLDFSTKMSNLKGITPEGSAAAWDLYVKAQYLDSISPGRSLVLASGTPVTNTMAELFTLSRFMQPKELEERGLAQFDAWAGAFGESVTDLEQDAAGGYKPVTRFSKFVNTAELSAMVRQVMDVVTSRQLDQYVTRPTLKGGKRIMNLAEKSPALERYQRSLALRMDAIAKRKGPPSKGDDIMLSVINDGRHAAIDLRLVGIEPDGKSKLDLMIDNVFRIWKETKRQKFYRPLPGGQGYESKHFDVGPATQMIFANLGLSGARGFSVPDYIRAELARRGIPKSEIAYIYNYKTHVARQKLFNDMNEGKVRILIGSTAKMATGVNAQRRLYALHNMDALWYPADDEQRNGRALRQGNLNPEIEIHDYATKGTYDSTMWGMMERKARFIQNFFEGDPSMRDMDDLGEASQYAQAKAITTNDPRLIKLTEIKQDLEKAERREAAFHQETYALRQRRVNKKHDLDYARKRIGDVKTDIAQRVDLSGDKFKAIASGKAYNKRADFGEAIMERLDALVKDGVEGKPVKVGSISDFPIYATPRKGIGGHILIDMHLERAGKFETDVDVGHSAVGLVRSLEAKLARFDADLADYEQRVAQATKFLAESEEAVKKTFDGGPAIEELRKQVRALEAELAAVETPADKAIQAQILKASAEIDIMQLGRVDLLQPWREARDNQPFKRAVGADAMFSITSPRRDAAAPTEARKEIERVLTALVRQTVGPNVRVAFPDRVPMPKGAASGWGDIDPGAPTAAGSYVPAQRLIRIAMADPAYDMSLRARGSTAAHEAFHAVEHLLLTDAEMKILRAEERRLRAIAERLLQGAGVSAGDAKSIAGYEARAIAFQAYARNRAETGKSLPQTVRRILNRLANLFNRIRNALRGLGYKTADDIFSEVYEGRMAGREPRPRAFSEAANISEDPDEEVEPEFDENARLASEAGMTSAGAIRKVRREGKTQSFEDFLAEIERLKEQDRLDEEEEADEAAQQPEPASRPAASSGDEMFVSAGARRIRPQEEPGADGKPQLIIPGAERISQKQQLDRKGAEPKRGKKQQQTVDGLPLFDNEPDPQGSLFSLVEEPRTAADSQRVMQGFLARGQYLDRAIRMPLDWFGGTTYDGQWKPGRYLFDQASRAITTAKFSPEGRFAFLNPALETARRGLVDRYGLTEAYVTRDRQRALDERAVMMRGAEILKQLKDHAVGADEARVLQAILTGEAVSEGDMGRLAEPIRLAIDQLGQDAVALGLVSAESFERNRGTYLHRVYKKHEAEQNGLVRMVNSIMGNRRKKIIGDQMKGRGIFMDVDLARLMKDVAAFHQGARGKPQKGDRFIRLDEMPEQGELALPGAADRQKPVRTVWWPADEAIPDRYNRFRNQGTFEIRGMKGGKFVLWRDFTREERDRMGEILDARYTIGKTFMLMAHDLAVGKFYRDIAQNEDWTQSTPPAGRAIDAAEWQRMSGRYKRLDAEWVKVPDTEIADTGGKKRYGALAGKWVREEIWRDINEQEIMSQPHVWRTLLTQWKLNKTARSPVVHMNNVMSNFVLMDLLDVRWQDLVAGIRSYAKGDANYEEAFANGAFGADMMTQEVREQVLKPVLEEIMRDSTFQQGGRLGTLGQMSRFTELLWSKAKALDKKMTDAYRLEDEIFRMATYMRRRQLGDDPKMAADIAREQFIDYDIRAPWVNAARNTVLPFISYTYRAVPLVAKAVATRPWKVGKYFLLSYVLNAVAYAVTGGDEDKERRSLRDNEQGHTWIGTERMVRMPINDAYGNPIFLDIRRWMPAGDVFDMSQGQSVLPLPAWLNVGGPVLLGFEALLNKQSFTGQPIVNDKTDDWWDKTAKVSDWAYKSWMPSAAYIPNSFYWDRVGNALKGATDPQGRPYDTATALASSVGVKLKPHDVDDALARKALDFRRIETELKAEAGRLARQHGRNLVSDAEFGRHMSRIEKKLERLREKSAEPFKD